MAHNLVTTMLRKVKRRLFWALKMLLATGKFGEQSSVSTRHRHLNMLKWNSAFTSAEKAKGLNSFFKPYFYLLFHPLSHHGAPNLQPMNCPEEIVAQKSKLWRI